MDADSTSTDQPAPGPESPDPAGSAGASARSRRNPIVTVGVLVALCAFVGAGIWYLSSRNGGSDPIAADDQGEVAVAAVDEGMEFGTEGGPIVDIYVDYQCIHCSDLEQVIGPEMIRLATAGDAELVIRPVKFVSRASGRGAAALYCAAEGGQAFAMHQRLLADIEADFSPEGLTAAAGTLGLDEAAFSECLTDKATTTWVNGVTATAETDGIAAIPAVFVDGTRLSDAQLASADAFRNAVLADGS